MMALGSQSSIYFRFVVSYTVVVAITLGIVLTGFAGIDMVAGEEELELARNQLVKQAELLESRFSDLEQSITKLASDQRVIDMMALQENYPLPKVYILRDAFNFLSNYDIPKSFITELFIYCAKPGVLVSSTQASLRVPEFYGDMFKYDGWDLRQWEERLGKNYLPGTVLPAMAVSRNGRSMQALTYLVSVPIGRSSQNRGIIFALIERKNIDAYLESLPFLAKGGLYSIRDRQGEPLLASAGTPQPGNQGNGAATATIRHTSALTGWTYEAAFPRSYIGTQREKFRNLFLITATLVFCFGLAAAVLFARRQSKPFDTILEILKKRQPETLERGENILDRMQRGVNDLASDHDRLAMEIRGFRPRLQGWFFERLVRGEFRSMDEIRAALPLADMDLSGDAHQLFVFLLHEPGTDRETRDDVALMLISLIEEFLEKLWKDQAYYIPQNKDRVVLLVPSPERKRSIVQAMMEEIPSFRSVVENNSAATLLVGESRVYASLTDTPFNYDELTRLMEYGILAGTKPYLRYDELPPSGSDCYFPLGTELQLSSALKKGDQAETDAILDELFRINRTVRSLSLAGFTELRDELMGTIAKVRREMERFGRPIQDIHDPMERCRRSATLESLREAMLGAGRAMCAEVLDFEKTATSHLVRDADRIVQEQYANTQLSLTLIADTLNVTAKYLSQLYKDETGKNLSAVIEELRFEKARELLEGTDMRVADVALAVGYLNLNTFLKAFKRHYNISPSDFRRA